VPGEVQVIDDSQTDVVGNQAALPLLATGLGLLAARARRGG